VNISYHPFTSFTRGTESTEFNYFFFNLEKKLIEENQRFLWNKFSCVDTHYAPQLLYRIVSNEWHDVLKESSSREANN